MIRHIAANMMSVLIVVMIGVLVLLKWAQSEYEGPGPLADATIVTVNKNDNIRMVTDQLEEVGAIRHPSLFRLAARYSGQDRKLKYGEYKLDPEMSAKEILALISSGRGVSYQVTIPEGWSSWQVVERLKEVADLTEEVELPSEGSLAPNTYAYARGDTRASMIEKMQEAQEQILAEAWENRAGDLPLESPFEALILASIVEKETGLAEERPQVASVFINRLRLGMKLQTDPTVIYGITNGEGSLGRGLRRSELQKPTPYNTYVIPALPPGPIANPGKAAIEAVLNPAHTDYIYFVADGSGGHAFAKTLQEHNENVKRWRAIEAERAAAAAEAAKNEAEAGQSQ